jgi:hypothetical protein
MLRRPQHSKIDILTPKEEEEEEDILCRLKDFRFSSKIPARYSYRCKVY